MLCVNAAGKIQENLQSKHVTFVVLDPAGWTLQIRHKTSIFVKYQTNQASTSNAQTETGSCALKPD